MKAALDAVIKYISSSKVRVLDFVDRCCCRYTPVILSILMLITGTIDTLGQPINCMVPQEFSESWTSYVHQYCYVVGTYIKNYDHDGNDKPIFVDYYQWVPFILIIQAIAMRLPHFFWRFGQSKTDIDFGHIHSLGEKIRHDYGGNRMDSAKQAAAYIFNIAKHRGFNGVGNTTFYFYIAFKLVNALMIILMIYFLTVFIGYRHPFWGITLAFQAWPNHNFSSNLPQPLTYFPRIAYCEYSMDALGSLDGGMIREVRCILGINMINEKVFLFLYFWYYALLAIVVMDTIFFVRYLNPFIRIQSIKDYLQLVNDESERDRVRGWACARCIPLDEKTVARFCKDVLGNDGLLLFRFLHQNFGKLIAMEICSQLYDIATENAPGTVYIAHCSSSDKTTNVKFTSTSTPMMKGGKKRKV